MQLQPPEETSTESQSARLSLVLSQPCRMGPQQINIVKVCVCDVSAPTVKASVIIPKEECDLLEGPWEGSSEFYVPNTNWAVVLEKGDVAT